MTVSVEGSDHFGVLKITISDDDPLARLVTLAGEPLAGTERDHASFLVPEIYINARGHTLRFTLPSIDQTKMESWEGGFEDNPKS